MDPLLWMDLSWPGWIWLAALIAGLLALIAMLIAIVSLKTARRLHGELQKLRSDLNQQETSLLGLHGAMKVIAEDVILHAQNQTSVSRTLERLIDQQSELRLRDVGEGLYGQAIQMIQGGRSREEVRKLLGLTESESELLFLLHAPGTARREAE